MRIVFKKKMLILVSILSLTGITASAQQEQEHIEQERIRRFFDEQDSWNTTKDSSMIYAFAFKAAVEKDNTGKIKIISLTASDSSAYTVYPNYKFLETINYSLFMEGRTKAEFIFPVFLDVWNSKLDNPLTYNHLGDKVMALFFYSTGSGFEAVQDRIYFRPHVLSMIKP